MRPLPLLVASSLILAAPICAAAEPPPGWVAPPPPVPPSARPTGAALCRAEPWRCSAKGHELESFPVDHVLAIVEVPFADLPEMVVKKAPAGGPPVAGAPIPGLKDGKGRPPPWPGGPQLEVRLVLPGAGESQWGNDSWEGWDPTGAGATHAVPQGRRTEEVLTGKVRYTAIDRRAAEKITYDYVRGAFAGKPELEVSLWGHAEAAHVAYGLVYAFRGWPPREPAFRSPDDRSPPEVIEEGPGAVCFVLPQVARGFESKDTKGAGGFFRVHGAVMHTYTTYALPAGPGRSGLAAFEMNDLEVLRGKPPAGAPALPRMVNRRPGFEVSGRFLLSSSQTTAEAQPRVRVVALSD